MNDIRVIMLGGKRGGFAIVDSHRFEEVNSFRWRLSSHGYVVRSEWVAGNTERIYLHKVIIQSTEDSDHRNRCKIDNTQRNLRPCSRRQNMANCGPRNRIGRSSIFKGVDLRKDTGKWRAQIRRGGKQTILGSFDSEVEAAQAYNFAATVEFGEFAHLNPV